MSVAGVPSKAPQLSISLGSTGGLRRTPHSAFLTFLRTPQSSHLASASSSAVVSPQLKNALAPSGAVLNDLQRLQLDIGGDSTATTASSSATLEKQSVSPDAPSPMMPDTLTTAVAAIKIAEDGAAEDADDDSEDAPDRSRKPLHRCTLDLLDLFRTCNPAYTWSGVLQPRRVLTSPSVPSLTNPSDNANHNLIMSVGDILWHNTEDSHVFRDKIKASSKAGAGKKLAKSFKVLELLGVVKCEEIISAAAATLSQPPAAVTHTSSKNRVYRAIKVIKNKPAYYNQALMEIQILKVLNEKHDPDNKHHLLRMIESFNHKGHLCLVFELLSVNLYDLMKQNGYRGLSWSLLRIFLKQILDSLSVLTSAKIIHCDLKPENILLNKLTAPDITLIDFGSACFESQTVYSYIQSRFYRSPEVLIGLPYTGLIDLWSFGCIGAELYLGLPLFPGITQQNQLYRIIKFIGPPPAAMLAKGKNTKKFWSTDQPDGPNAPPRYTLKTAEQYAAETHTDVAVHKHYFKGNVLKEVVDLYPMRKGMSEAQKVQELEDRKCFLHFLQGFLRWDASTRWLPRQAMQHPFLQRQPLASLNEHAFEQLRFVIDQPVSIPPVPSAIAASAAASTPAAAATSPTVLSTAVASAAASAAALSLSPASATASSRGSLTNAVGSPSKGGIGAHLTGGAATTVGALLTNQELAARQQQQAQLNASSLSLLSLQQQQPSHAPHHLQQTALLQLQQQQRNQQAAPAYGAPAFAAAPQHAFDAAQYQQQMMAQRLGGNPAPLAAAQQQSGQNARGSFTGQQQQQQSYPQQTQQQRGSLTQQIQHQQQQQQQFSHAASTSYQPLFQQPAHPSQHGPAAYAALVGSAPAWSSVPGAAQDPAFQDARQMQWQQQQQQLRGATQAGLAAGDGWRPVQSAVAPVPPQ